MEKIGVTTTEDVLVKMTREEFGAFKHLGEAIEGRMDDRWKLQYNEHIVLPDFTGVFGAIEAFALAQFRVNELQGVLDRFKKELNKTT
jgi:hypothetical protein